MDTSGPSKPANPSGQPASTDKATPASKSNNKAGHGGRTVSPKDASSIIAEAQALAGADKDLTKRAVAGRKTNAEIIKAGNALDQSNQAIKDFIKANKLNKVCPVKYDLDRGFSPDTHRHFIVMSQLNDLIEEHTRLLNQVYGVIAPGSERLKVMNKVARASAVKKELKPEEQAALDQVSDIPGIDERKALYWGERAYIRLYSAFCKQRFVAVCRTSPTLGKVGDQDIFTLRAEEFIVQSLEWMKVLVEVMQCSIAQNNVTELEDCIRNFDGAAEGIVAMLQESEKLYMVHGKREALRQVLEENRQYLEHWLEIFCESRQKAHNSPKCINAITAAIILDKPHIALNLQEIFNHQVKNGDFPAKDCFRLCLSLISAMTWLYDRPEPLGEHKERVEGAEKIVNAFAGLIRHIDENQLLSDEERASLLRIFGLIEGYCHEEVLKLRVMEQRVLETGAALVREEDKQKQKIQATLERRERRRQKRLAEQQAKQEAEQEAARETAPSADASARALEKEPDKEPDKDSLPLHPSLRKGLEAIAQSKPNKEIKSAFKEVIDDQNASVFDQAQAHYGYADILAIRLAPCLEKLNALVDATYSYEQVLQTGQLPSSHQEFRFNDVLRDIQAQVQDMNWVILEMAQAIERALDVFYKLGDEQVDFLDQLLDLHQQAEELIEKAKRASECCKKLPEIYRLRGRVLKNHLAAVRTGEEKKNSSERRKIIEASIRDIQDFSLKLDGSLKFLGGVLSREKIEASVTDAQQHRDETLAAEEPVATVESAMSDSATDLQPGAALPSAVSVEQALPDEPVPSTSSVLESGAVAQEPDKPAAFELPVGLFMPEDIFISLNESLDETGLSWRMGSNGLTASDGAHSSVASTEPNQPARSKKKGKGKKRQAIARKHAENHAGNREALPVADDNLMLLRVRDYLKTLITHQHRPDGTPLPDNYNLEAVKARIQARTFLSNPRFQEDFMILADALGVSVRLTASATNVFNCSPGLGKPVKIEMNEYPDAPYLPLEYFASEKERCWYPSLTHLFRHVEEKTAKELESRKP